MVWGDYLEPPDKITAGTGKGEHMLKTEPATGGIFREVDVRGAGGGSGRGVDGVGGVRSIPAYHGVRLRDTGPTNWW